MFRSDPTRRGNSPIGPRRRRRMVMSNRCLRSLGMGAVVGGLLMVTGGMFAGSPGAFVNTGASEACER